MGRRLALAKTCVAVGEASVRITVPIDMKNLRSFLASACTFGLMKKFFTQTWRLIQACIVPMSSTSH